MISLLSSRFSPPSLAKVVASPYMRRKNRVKPITFCVHQCPTPKRETFHIIRKSEVVSVRPATKAQKRELYYLSNIDQNLSLPLEMIYSFKADDGMARTDNACEVLKNSLAEVLDHFYPLAGRLTMSPDGKNVMVKCSGEGVYFVEAIADDIELDEFGDISVPNAPKLGQLIHVADGKDIFDMPLMTVQVTMFKCGGFILGMVLDHCMMDGASITLFLNSWAEVARGLPLRVAPFLDRSIFKGNARRLLFPQTEIKQQFFYRKDELLAQHTKRISHGEQVIYKLIHFNHDKLVQLKETVIEKEGSTWTPTNFEVITAILWHAMVLSLAEEAPERTKVFIPMNSRMLLGRLFPKGYFGNCLSVAYLDCSTEELVEMPFISIVKQVHEATKRVSLDYMQSHLDYLEAMEVLLSFENAFVFSNLTRLPFYKADFGWGDPKNFGFVRLPKNFTFFLPQPNVDRNNVNVAVGLPPAAMVIFQESLGGN